MDKATRIIPSSVLLFICISGATFTVGDSRGTLTYPPQSTSDINDCSRMSANSDSLDYTEAENTASLRDANQNYRAGDGYTLRDKPMHIARGR